MQSKQQLSAAGIKGGSQPKHKWTDEESSIVLRDYQGTNASAQEIGDRLGVTKWAVKGQAARLGILLQKSPDWTPAEIQQLEQLIPRHPIGEIAKKLHRSSNAVKIKATRLKLKLSARDQWYTKMEACQICGVDHKKMQQWIDSGALVASWHYGTKPCRKGRSDWHIEAKDLRTFIIKYCGELLGRNVDLQQIVWLLVDGELQDE